MKNRYIVVIMVLPMLLFAQFGGGLQQGVRQQALGGAYTGLADEGEAVYYNPAGLTNLKRAEFISMYARQLAHLIQGDQKTGVNVSYLGYAQNFGDKIGSFGLRHYYRGYSFGEVFNASEHQIMVGYGRSLADLDLLFPEKEWTKYFKSLSVGLGLKAMNYGFSDAPSLKDNSFVGNQDNVDGWTWSMDLSLFYQLDSAWSMGCQFKDFNRPNSSLVNEATYLDLMDYSLGVAWRYGENRKDLIVGDLISENGTYAIKAGTEKVWNFTYQNGVDEIALRTGAHLGFEDDYNCSLGMGYLLTKVGNRMAFDFDFDIRFDYSYKVLFGTISDGPANHSWQMTFLLP